MKEKFITTTFLLLSLIIKVAAQTTPGPPARFDFESTHNNIIHSNPANIPYTPAAPQRFDFETPHKDTLHTNPSVIPYTPGVPRRFDFESSNRQTNHKN